MRHTLIPTTFFYLHVYCFLNHEEETRVEGVLLLGFLETLPAGLLRGGDEIFDGSLDFTIYTSTYSGRMAGRLRGI